MTKPTYKSTMIETWDCKDCGEKCWSLAVHNCKEVEFIPTLADVLKRVERLEGEV